MTRPLLVVVAVDGFGVAEGGAALDGEACVFAVVSGELDIGGVGAGAGSLPVSGMGQGIGGIGRVGIVGKTCFGSVLKHEVGFMFLLFLLNLPVGVSMTYECGLTISTTLANVVHDFSPSSFCKTRTPGCNCGSVLVPWRLSKFSLYFAFFSLSRFRVC